MQKIRDSYLTKCKERFGEQIDLAEIYEILREFKQPFRQMMMSQNQMVDG